MKKTILSLAILAFILLSSFTPYQEPFRPQLHYTPYENWMNDPNGLVYDAESDTYHMYFQYCRTLKEDQGEKYWGHATSKDLIHWEEQDTVLAPDEYGSIWSGSCVIDKDNTSGLFSDDIPPASRIVALFTYAGGNTEYGYEKQGLAYSTDAGYTFKKYGKPVITNSDNTYSDGFRDPKVIWHEESKTWIMVIGGGPVRLFTSMNLIDWEFNSVLKYKDGSNIDAECPDLFPMQTENSEETMWIFQGAGRSYAVGNLTKDNNGKFQFKAVSDKQSYVSDNTVMYAAQTFFNDAKGRRIAIFWLIDLFSKSVDENMGKIWDGVQSLPLELKLYRDGEGYIIKANPVEEVMSLRKSELFSCNNVTLSPDEGNILEGIKGSVLEIETVLDAGNAGRINIEFRKGNSEKTVLVYNAKSQNLSLVCKDSGVSGDTVFVKLPDENGKIKLRIIIDNTVVDVFANEGRKVLSAHIFPSEQGEGLNISVENGDAFIESLKVYELSSIWTCQEDKTPEPVKKQINTLYYILVVALAAFLICFIICVTVINIRKIKTKRGF